MLYHNLPNIGVYLEDVFKKGMREAANHMTKPTTYLGGRSWPPHKGHTASKITTYIKSPLTDYCDETKNFQPKTRLVSFSNKKYLLRHGAGSLGFIVIHKNDFTIAHIHRIKDKDWISTRRFSGKLTWKKVKKLLFKHAVHIADLKKKEEKPFKTIHRQIVMPMKEFEDKFKPNEQMKKSYASTAKDTALTSLSTILEDRDIVEMDAGTHSAALNNVSKSVGFTKHSYKGDRPAVSIHAIWCNFDPESKLVNTGDFDIGEPVFYQYEVMD